MSPIDAARGFVADCASHRQIICASRQTFFDCAKCDISELGYRPGLGQAPAFLGSESHGRKPERRARQDRAP